MSFKDHSSNSLLARSICSSGWSKTLQNKELTMASSVPEEALEALVGHPLVQWSPEVLHREHTGSLSNCLTPGSPSQYPDLKVSTKLSHTHVFLAKPSLSLRLKYYN